jgi:hypothetical protein
VRVTDGFRSKDGLFVTANRHVVYAASISTRRCVRDERAMLCNIVAYTLVGFLGREGTPACRRGEKGGLAQSSG